MKANILVNILAQRINPEHFQLWGLEIHWMSEEYNTEANRAIVVDVIAIYPALEAAYLAEQQAIKDAKLAKAQEIIDNLPAWQPVSDAIDSATTIAALKAIVKKLARVVFIHLREQ